MIEFLLSDQTVRLDAFDADLTLLDSFVDPDRMTADATSSICRVWTTNVAVFTGAAETPVVGADVKYYQLLSGGGRSLFAAAVTDVDGVTDEVFLMQDITTVLGREDVSAYEVDITSGGTTITVPHRAERPDVLPIFWDAATGNPGTPAIPAARVTIHPNPFNPETTVQLDVTAAGPARVEVFDTRGTRVRTLHEGHLTVGAHDLAWDGRDERRRPLASGVYYIRLQDAAGAQSTGKAVLVR